MDLSIGSAAYKTYVYTTSATGEKNRSERLSVGKGRLTQELSQKQGRHYDAVSKYGDTLEISNAARNLMMGMEEPEQSILKQQYGMQNPSELQNQVSGTERGERNLSTIDYSISDDRVYTNL